MDKLKKELKAVIKEYNKHNKMLEKLKKNNVDPNDPILLNLKILFEEDLKKIDDINKRLEELANK